MSPDVFYVEEGANQLHQFIFSYWFLILLIFLFGLGAYYFSDCWKKKVLRPSSIVKRATLAPVLVLITVLAIRGGWQSKVLKPMNAYRGGHFDLGNLKLNSTFTLFGGGLNRGIKKRASYFKSQEEVVAHIGRAGPSKVFAAPEKTARKKDNVVLLILESFATEFWGIANDYPGHTPFLDSLAKKGLFFKRNFSNSRGSMKACFTILLGVPPLMPTPLAISNYQQNRWFGLGHLLNSAGYHTSFFQGARMGSVYLSTIAALSGINDLYSIERYPHPEKDHDGSWGIFDGPYLQFAAKEISKHSEPFFTTIFTLTSHQPYKLPKEHQGKFPEGTLKVHPTIAYVDDAVKQFFKTIENEPWFKNTLFIITADHTQLTAAEHYNTVLGRFMVPLMIYHPGRELPAINENKVTDHTDIIPTIVDYLGLPDWDKVPLFGRSVFDDSHEGKAILHLGGNYWLVTNDYFLNYSLGQEEKVSLFDHSDYPQKNALDRPRLKKSYSIVLRGIFSIFVMA